MKNIFEENQNYFNIDKVLDDLIKELYNLDADADEKDGDYVCYPVDIIVNEPATIIRWNDGDKTVVKCMESDTFDEEKGIMMAYLTKMFGKAGLKTLLRSARHQDEKVKKVKKEK